MKNLFRKNQASLFETTLNETRKRRDDHLGAMEQLESEIKELQDRLTEHQALYAIHNEMLSKMVNVGNDLDLINEDPPQHLQISNIELQIAT